MYVQIMTKGWKKNVSLKKFTSFQIGGKARFFSQVFSEEELKEVVAEAREKNLPIFILGGGTNILFPDQGFPGLVIQMALGDVQWLSSRVVAGAGVPLPFLVEEARKRGLSGLEWGAGIPGTLGGAVRGNAGTKQEFLSQHLEKVKALDQEKLIFREYLTQDGKFSYRQSIFKQLPQMIITSAVLKLEPANLEKIEKKMTLNFQARRKQPLDFPSAGSVFKNPSLAPAGQLIDQTGLKGKRTGKAQVSLRHANFIVNLGGARSAQVLTLIHEVEASVKDKFGVSLEREIVVVEEKEKKP
jgi:UDP-N-acetylmuramate dehydrogenase